MSVTVNFEGQEFDMTGTGAQFKFASFYRMAGSDKCMVKVHRTEAAARKGQWDSSAMRKVWVLAGHAPIVRN